MVRAATHATKATNDPSDLNQLIARRVAELRASRGFSLDALADISGVSRSMISLIERGESSPTAVVLEKVATGLGVTLASIFVDASAAPSPVSRLDAQPVWRDPASGYVRRNVSPPGFASPIQIVEVEFPARARVAYETSRRESNVHEQIWVLDGSIEVTVGKAEHTLTTGDCLALVLNEPTMFFNPTKSTTRYAVVIVTECPMRR
jgi:transcriptional regulator with XRE-family HTH domain